MIEAIDSLKNTKIIYSENITALKQSIYQKYPQFSSKDAAALFATAVHRILDKNIISLDKTMQNHIKVTLLREAIKKETFDINAYDVFKACSSLDLSDEACFERLADWINRHHKGYFSKEEVFMLLQSMKEGTLEKQELSKPTPLASISAPPVSSEAKAAVSSPAASASDLWQLPFFLGILKNKLLQTLEAPSYMLFISALILLAGLGTFRLTTPTDYSKEAPLPSYAKHIPTQNQRDLFEKSSPSLNESCLPQDFQYKRIDTGALYHWLNKKNSLLAEPLYFNQMIKTAKHYNINPLLMFAIVGQEQSFVPKSHPKAALIANNPFNVYGSWEDFNTNIEDTSKIAARTILTLGKDCPKDEPFIKWLNRKYAEDPSWHIGVSQIFEELETTAGN